jgi:hypothetical protein
MKNIALLLLLISTSACEKLGLGPKDASEIIENKIHPDSKIVGLTVTSGINGRYEIIAGDKQVFEFFHSDEGEELIADDEFYEWFVFQIPAETQKLDLKDEEILALNPVYRYSCYCTNDNGLSDLKGTLTLNKKKGEKYTVEADLSFFIIIPQYNEQGQEISKFVTREQKLQFKQTFER